MGVSVSAFALHVTDGQKESITAFAATCGITARVAMSARQNGLPLEKTKKQYVERINKRFAAIPPSNIKSIAQAAIDYTTDDIFRVAWQREVAETKTIKDKLVERYSDETVEECQTTFYDILVEYANK